MKRYLHKTNLHTDAQNGWEQMQLLLDKNLPVIINHPKSRFLFRTLISTSFILIFLLSGLVLNDHKKIKYLNNIYADNMDFYDSTNHRLPSVVDDDIKRRSEDIVSVQRNNNSSGDLVKVMNIQIERQHKDSYKINLSTLVDSAQPGKMLNKNLSKPQEELLQNQTDISKPSSKWYLYAGLAINATNTKEQIFRPYPLAILRYDLSKKFFLSSSLSVGSSISSESQGLDKKIYINDTINNILYYDKVKHYHNVVYSDISVSGGINLGSNISLQAGIQAAVLIKAKSKTVIEPYDFQMRSTGSANDNIIPVVTALPVNTTDYNVGIRRFDYRFTTGINYNKNKFGFGLTYQHSFMPMIKGDVTSGNKNQLVTFNVLYKIK